MTMLDPGANESFATRAPTAGGKNGVLARLNAIEGFEPTYVVLKGFSPNGIALDPASRRVFLIRRGNLLEKRFEDLLESEVVIDGVTVMKANLSSRIIGATIGGVLAGGVGAVVGGMAQTTTIEKTVRQVTAKILLNDLDYPSHSIEFIGITWYGETYPRIAIPEAQQLHDYLRVVVHQNQTGSFPAPSARHNPAPDEGKRTAILSGAASPSKPAATGVRWRVITYGVVLVAASAALRAPLWVSIGLALIFAALAFARAPEPAAETIPDQP